MTDLDNEQDLATGKYRHRGRNPQQRLDYRSIALSLLAHNRTTVRLIDDACIIHALTPADMVRYQLLCLCKHIVKFTLRYGYWPTPDDLFEKYNRGDPLRFRKRAIDYYAQFAIEHKYAERLPSGAIQLAQRFYTETFTEPIETVLSDTVSGRTRQRKFVRRARNDVKLLAKLTEREST